MWHSGFRVRGFHAKNRVYETTLTLKAQKKDFAALMVKREFDAAWKDADTLLKIEGVRR
jgi:hypothetical protein